MNKREAEFLAWAEAYSSDRPASGAAFAALATARNLFYPKDEERELLMNLLDSGMVAVEFFKDDTPALKTWKEEWLTKARGLLLAYSTGENHG